MMGAVLWSSEGGSLSLLWRPVSRQVVGLGGRESCGRVKETRAQKTTNELTCWRKKRTKKKREWKFFWAQRKKKKKEFFLDETGTLHLKASSFISTRHAQKSRATFVFWGFSHFFFCSSSSSFLKNSRPGVASGTPPMRQKFVLMIFFVSSQLSRRSSSTNEPSVN